MKSYIFTCVCSSLVEKCGLAMGCQVRQAALRIGLASSKTVDESNRESCQGRGGRPQKEIDIAPLTLLFSHILQVADALVGRKCINVTF